MRWILAVAVMASGLAVGPCAQASSVGTFGDWMIGDYRVQVTADAENGFDTIHLSYDGQLIYQLSDAGILVQFDLADTRDASPPLDPNLGIDILDLDAPVLAITRWSGGAHCCHDTVILVLGKSLEVIPIPEIMGSYRSPAFVRLGSGEIVLETSDHMYAFWRTSYVSSPFPTVLMRFDRQQRRFVPTTDLMKKDRPAEEELWKRVRSAYQAHKGYLTVTGLADQIPGEIGEVVVDLIYSGQLPLAADFLRRAWAGSDERREEYWTALTECRLRKSAFWPAVAKLNGLPADPPRCTGTD